jgi:Putative zinc-finger
MTCEQCHDRLGDVVERTLDSGQQAQVDAHIRGCSACRDLLDDLMEIRAAAATLDRRTPSPELWRAIAAKIESADSAAVPSAAGKRTSAWSQLSGLAAAAAVLIMLGTAAWFALGTRWRGGDGTPPDLVRNAASELQLAEQHYQNAISALEQLTANKDSALDPSVSAEIAESLRSIDRAIDDSRAALKSDPNSFVARTSLLEALRMKVAVLQETVSLMNARS